MVCDVALWLPNSHPILINQQNTGTCDAAMPPAEPGNNANDNGNESTHDGKRVKSSDDSSNSSTMNKQAKSKQPAGAALAVAVVELGALDFLSDDGGRSSIGDDPGSSKGYTRNDSSDNRDPDSPPGHANTSAREESQAPDAATAYHQYFKRGTTNNTSSTSPRPLTLKVCQPVLFALKRCRSSSSSSHHQRIHQAAVSLWPRRIEVYRGACGWGPPPPSSLSAGLYQGAVGFVAQSSQVTINL